MIRTLICALALIYTASVGLACSGHSKQTQSCAEGTFWDSDTKSCMKLTSS
ncbi:adenylosuccinate lyase [Ruegeria sp.]|uniref:adenylosuccinate lyase n=1 Tax=Ruegeria sp. TaxID=1879320 RepID=UPI002313A046|nr:adenylosuccinate lyase [Ruegeria sp.]MDA7963372.1 adenylosuccinate lyase [Ruegeria sp.]